MNPIAAALEGFDLTYILAAGGAVIVFVLAYVGIDKVKELVSGEEKEDGYTYYFNPETGAITGVRGSDGVYRLGK